MKNVTFFKSLAAVAALALSTSVWALPVDIGAVDTLAGDADLADTFTNPDAIVSGDANEIEWMNALLGTSYTSADFVKWNVGDGEVTVTEEGGMYFFSFGDYRPDYFFVKYGAGNDPFDHYLYVNNANMAYGYVSAAPGGFSHVGFFGSPTEVPEPTSLALLGLGLAGLGFARRRKA